MTDLPGESKLNADKEESSRIASLESRYTHLDGRVSSIAEDMSAIKVSLASLLSSFDKVSSRVNQPAHVNYVGIAAVIVSLAFGGSQYLDLRLSPVRETVDENQHHIDQIKMLQHERAGVVGNYSARLEALERVERHSDELRHELEKRVNVLEGGAGEARVSRRAIGDYVKYLAERIDQPAGQ